MQELHHSLSQGWEIMREAKQLLFKLKRQQQPSLLPTLQSLWEKPIFHFRPVPVVLGLTLIQ